MIIDNPDEQVWKLLTGGAGCSAGRKELEQLKGQLKAQGVFFVVDHDDRYHWIRLRSRYDLQIIQIKADVLAEDGSNLLEVCYAGNTHTHLSAAEALPIVLQYYLPDNGAAAEKNLH